VDAFVLETSPMADDTQIPSRRREPATVSEVIEYITTYAKQETIGPLRGAGRWIGMGAAGAVALGTGLCILLLGLLRLLQTETGFDTSEYWSWVPYVIVFVVGALFAVLAILQVNKTYLDKEDE
jgi:hypothetical protein